MPTHLPCSIINAHTPLAGTAPVSDSWLVLFHQGAWGSDPVETLVSQELKDWAQDHAAQVLLARSPHRADPHPDASFWFSSGQGELLQGKLESNGLPDLEVATISQPMLLICTNGKRDQCCATFGRSLITQCEKLLSSALFAGILECSHLGGHRFAPTAIWMPENLVLGRLDPTSVAGLVEKGEIDSKFVRGHTRLTPAQQVVEVAVWPLTPHFRTCTQRENDLEIEAEIDGVSQTFVVETHHANLAASCGAQPKDSTQYHIKAAN
jgi:hypothetical protein